MADKRPILVIVGEPNVCVCVCICVELQVTHAQSNGSQNPKKDYIELCIDSAQLGMVKFSFTFHIDKLSVDVDANFWKFPDQDLSTQCDCE